MTAATAQTVPAVDQEGDIQIQTIQHSLPLQENVLIRSAYLISCDYINDSLRLRNIFWEDCPLLPAEPSVAVVAMRRLGREFETRNLQTLADLSANFVVEPETIWESFHQVAEGIFSDGSVRWGRIVALISWSGVLAARCYRQNHPELIGSVAAWTAEFVETKLYDWILANGGWEGLVNFAELPSQNESEGKNWPVIVGAGVIGLGAVALGAIIVGGK